MATIGDEVTYTISYINHGPATATQVVIHDIFPSDVLNLDSSMPLWDVNDGNMYVWNIGTLLA